MKAIYKVLFLCGIHICFVSMNGMLNLSTKKLKDFRLLKQVPQQRFIQTQKPQSLTLSPLLSDKFSGLKSTIKHYWNELSVFTYKNIWSNYFAFNGESATKLLESTWKTNPQLAENLGLFIFQRIAKQEDITYEIGQCLAEIVKIFILNEKDVPEDILEFIVLNDKDGFAFRHLNNVKIELLIYSRDSRAKELLKTKFFKRLIPILKKYKKLYIKREIMMVNLIELFDGVDDPDFVEVIFGLDRELSQTPSFRHLQHNYGALRLSVPQIISGYGYIVDFLSNSNFMHMVQQIIYKEKELIDAGYEVFYHGRRWGHGFLSDIYGMLYSYKSGKELNDFMFTHIDDPVLGKVSEKFYTAEAEKRERLIKEGNPYNSKKHSFGIINRASLLFLNKFLFGNFYKLDSSSFFYVLIDRNVGKITFPIKEIFNMFGCHDAYQEFAQQLNDLRQEYNNLSSYGELLQIAVPKKNVDKCIYYTRSGGPKEEFYSSETDRTTDINVILKYVDKNTLDEIEFVLVETHDKFGGLNPKSGIKVFSYNAVDPEKWRQFKEKEAALFERIQEWMQQRETKVEQNLKVRE